MNGKSESDAISLYIHLPFCKKKCPYCHFYVVLDKEPLKDALLHALLIEWQRIKEKLTHHRLVSLYFGGGTPALFGAKRLNILMNEIAKSARLDNDIEITLEANPESVTKEALEVYRHIGINRLSLGVQSFNDADLVILGRKHSSSKAKEALFDAHHAGFTNITIDLMYELPKQTLNQWLQTLDEIGVLPITHISLYNLTIEAHTAFEKKKKELLPLLPSDEEGANMYTKAIGALTSKGFSQYEISAFCKDDKYSIHNIGYWQGRPFFGMGPSAFSYYNNARFQNVANLSRYCNLLSENKTPVDFIEHVDTDARRRELLAIGLRVCSGVALAEFEQKFGQLDKTSYQVLHTLEQQGLLEKIDSRLCLTRKGILFYDTVASELI